MSSSHRRNPDLPQDLSSDVGKILRLNDEDMTFWAGDRAGVPQNVRRGIAYLDGSPQYPGVILPFRAIPATLSGPTCAQETVPRERVFFCEILPVECDEEKGHQMRDPRGEGE